MLRLPDWARPLLIGVITFVLMVLAAPVWQGANIGVVAFIASMAALLAWFAVAFVMRRR